MTQKESVANIPHKKVQTVSTKPDMIFVFLVSAYNTAFVVGIVSTSKKSLENLQPCPVPSVSTFDSLGGLGTFLSSKSRDSQVDVH